MKFRSYCLLFSALFLLAFVHPLYAESDRYVRLRHVEGDVRINPSDGERPEDAAVNYPVLDGDEIVTEDGRAELSFRNGVVLRIGDYSSVRLESAYTPVRIILLEGTLFVDSHLIESFRDELEIQAGDAQVYLIDEGNMRVDLGREGSVRVTSIEGEAEIRAAGRRVLLERGERTYIDPGQSPERPEDMYGETDELDDWNEDRMSQYARYDDEYEDYVDDNVYYDAYDLSGYGDWRDYGSYGNVWVPHVSFGWRPYHDGRWVLTRGSWFWVSYEPWGWAPYHYGRWGWGHDLGWYWIPGNSFAPAWVSWYDYGDYVGWCPLNYYNRPIWYYGGGGYYGGYHDSFRYPRIQKQKTLDITDSWTFVKKRDIGRDSIKKISIDPREVKKIKIDEKRVIKNPKKELISYALPKNAKVRGYVNDQRTVPQQQKDVKNPYGIKNRDEKFERGNTAGRDVKSNQGRDRDVVEKSGKRDSGRSWEGERERSAKPERSREVEPRDIEKGGGGDEKSKNRDSQFERKFGGVKPSGEYRSPYYRERETRSKDPEFQERERDSNRKENPYFSPRSRESSKDRRSSDDNRREVNPRYLDEARKIFDRLEEQRSRERERNDVDNRDKNRRYEPRYEPSNRDRGYEPSRREYKPNVKRESPRYSQPKQHNTKSRGNSKPPKSKD